jgi:hypothetical protein
MPDSANNHRVKLQVSVSNVDDTVCLRTVNETVDLLMARPRGAAPPY